MRRLKLVHRADEKENPLMTVDFNNAGITGREIGSLSSSFFEGTKFSAVFKTVRKQTSTDYCCLV